MSEEKMTNVLIIGKSGAGKSALLNYLLGEEVEPTGSGKPVTGKGVFPHLCQWEDGYFVGFYDTWGLEADKEQEWMELILEEIRTHEEQTIKEWFHTILYCINANAARIEPFELELLKKLKSEGNHVLVVFTHCDRTGNHDTIEAMKQVLYSQTISPRHVVEVCSEQKRLLNGTVTEPFGREAIWSHIKQGLWQKMVEKIPKQAKAEADALLSEAERDCHAYIEAHGSLLGLYLRGQEKKVNTACEQILRACSAAIDELYQQKCSEALAFYREQYPHPAILPPPFAHLFVPHLSVAWSRGQYQKQIEEQVEQMRWKLEEDAIMLHDYLAGLWSEEMDGVFQNLI
ncbi:MAG: GTPase domain-containing protein [Lachnospiraceae bacterium]|nr:GTPase domain-containing protein [Lachnospiraceae bacterium]